jgi:hypothetical protein
MLAVATQRSRFPRGGTKVSDRQPFFSSAAAFTDEPATPASVSAT